MAVKKSEIAAWIIDHNCVEFNVDGTATYFLRVTREGELTTHHGADGETITETIDVSRWAEDDSPERFYEEFETEENPEFMKLVERFADQIGGAAE